MLTIVVAVNNKNVIGDANKLPWSDKEDIERLYEILAGRDIIVGKRTYETLPQKARDRLDLVAGKMYICSRTELSYQTAMECAPDAFVIGGAEIYKAAIESGMVKFWYVTHIDDDSDGDTLFPADLGDITNS